MLGFIRRKKHIITIILGTAAIGLEVYYTICADSCSYLQGTLAGIPLQYIGMAYMICLITLSLLRKSTLVFLLVSAGVGVEFYLIGFQIYYNTYCLYCLGFAAILFILYFIHYERRYLVPGLVIMAISLSLFAIFFKGSLIPTYTYTQRMPSASGFRF